MKIHKNTKWKENKYVIELDSSEMHKLYSIARNIDFDQLEKSFGKEYRNEYQECVLFQKDFIQKIIDALME